MSSIIILSFFSTLASKPFSALIRTFSFSCAHDSSRIFNLFFNYFTEKYFSSSFLFQLVFSAFLPIGLSKSIISSTLPLWSYISRVWGISFLGFSLDVVCTHSGKSFNNSQQCSYWKWPLWISLNNSFAFSIYKFKKKKKKT